MMTAGCTLILLAILRAFADDPKIWPISSRAKHLWGAVILVGIVLIALSVLEFLWSHMP